jgi:hypothetical protein
MIDSESLPPKEVKFYLGVITNISSREWSATVGGNVSFCTVKKWTSSDNIPVSLASSQLISSRSVALSGIYEERRSVAVEGFREGDLVLFLPVRDGRVWGAFGLSCPHYYLDSCVDTSKRGYVVGRLTRVEEFTSRKGEVNLYGVKEGTAYHVCDIIVVE